MNQERITIKEVFERLVTLETKFDLKKEGDRRIAHRFFFFSIIIIVLEIFNLIVHSLFLFS